VSNISVDVLFPYYGDVGMMKKAVCSVLNQTYPYWQLKVFDDGYKSSEPATFFNKLIAKEIEMNGKSRISYEKNAKNLGANGNYRKALAKATSEYYVMMGADDMMLPNFLEMFIKRLKELGEIDIYQPNVQVIDENDQVYLPLVDKIKRMVMPKYGGVFKGEKIAKSYIHGWHYFPSIIWRTKSAKKVGFNTNYGVVQDVNMGLDIIQNGGMLYFDKDHVTFSYRRHLKSDSSIKALDGVRFAEEKAFYQIKAQQFHKLGWYKAEKIAKRHVFSKLNALSLLPKAIISKNGQPSKLLWHILN
jgi:glycosyltransferase involved in cell wall biosynthesis